MTLGWRYVKDIQTRYQRCGQCDDIDKAGKSQANIPDVGRGRASVGR